MKRSGVVIIIKFAGGWIHYWTLRRLSRRCVEGRARRESRCQESSAGGNRRRYDRATTAGCRGSDDDCVASYQSTATYLATVTTGQMETHLWEMFVCLFLNEPIRRCLCGREQMLQKETRFRRWERTRNFGFELSSGSLMIRVLFWVLQKIRYVFLVNAGLGCGLLHHFGSGSVQFFTGTVWFGFLHIFYFLVQFGSWQYLGPGSVRSYWVLGSFPSLLDSLFFIMTANSDSGTASNQVAKLPSVNKELSDSTLVFPISPWLCGWDTEGPRRASTPVHQLQFIFFTVHNSTGIRGLTRGMATLPKVTRSY